MTQIIEMERYQLSKNFHFKLRRCNVKISKNVVPRLIFRFHIFWNLQYLLSKLLVGFDIKTVFSCENWLFNYYCTPMLFPLYTNLLMASSMKVPYLENALSDFKQFCTKIELKNSYLGNIKRSILNFWPNWSMLMFWVT